jgi:hypothetical protein
MLSARLGGPGRLQEAIVRVMALRGNHYSLGHALLAGLPVREVITTNYDRLFDAAWDAATACRRPFHPLVETARPS